jgi:hypothetical protein
MEGLLVDALIVGLLIPVGLVVLLILVGSGCQTHFAITRWGEVVLILPQQPVHYPVLPRRLLTHQVGGHVDLVIPVVIQENVFNLLKEHVCGILGNVLLLQHSHIVET